jgi:DNA-binding transcriptional regulator YiaG
VLLGRFPYSRDMVRTLDETRRKRREAMRRYRARLRSQYEPLTPTQIRQLRERLSLRQRAFAARVGVEMGTIVRWEKGRTTPRFLATERLRELQRESEAP